MRIARPKRRLCCEELESRRVLATITVTTLNDAVDIPATPALVDLPGPDGVVSLREAFLVANEITGMDTVEFDPGIVPGIVEVTNGNLISYDSLRISGPDASELTIDLSGNEIHFLPPAGTDDRGEIEVVGLEITNGLRAIRTDRYDLKVVDAVFRNNDIAFGVFDDAVRSVYLGLDSFGSTFENNRGVIGGFPERPSGFVYANFSVEMEDTLLIASEFNPDFGSTGQIRIARSHLSGNSLSARQGGTVYGNVTVTDSEGIGDLFACQNVTVRNSTVTGHISARCDNFGGVQVDDSKILGDIDLGFGGSSNSTRVSITNSSVSGSVAADLVNVSDSWVASTNSIDGSIENSTITEGASGGAGNGGGGLGFLTVSNSTISGTLAFFEYDNVSPRGTISSSIVSNVLVSDSYGSDVQSLGNNIIVAVNADSDDLSLDPSDLIGVSPRLSELLVHAESGKRYFTPLPGSPAIDGGSNSAGLITDQLGNTRVVDGDFDGIQRADIGSIEIQEIVTAIDDEFPLNVNSTSTVQGNLLANELDPASQGGLTLISLEPDVGDFGSVVWQSNGDFEYTVDLDNPDVAGLDPMDTLVDIFNYQITDGVNAAMAQLVISIGSLPIDVFSGSDSMPSESRNDDVDLGDLDGDGDLDAFVTTRNGGNQVWLNEGSGTFLNSGQSLGSSASVYADLADLDGDGDLDAVVAALDAVVVWRNLGLAQFELAMQFNVDSAIDVALNDLDGDGDQDLYVAQNGAGDLVLLNDGDGNLTDSGQQLGDSASKGVEFGDIDNDGDLDAVVATQGNPGGAPNRIWLNDGNATLLESAHPFGDSETQHVALGDLDGDGDLDAIAANSLGLSDTNRVWLNDGSGVFRDSGQRLGDSSTSHVAVADVDFDGDLDAYAANWNDQPDVVWINDGSGRFSQGQSLGMDVSSHVAFGDVDGDSDLDAVVATFDEAQPVRVWQNDTPGLVAVNDVLAVNIATGRTRWNVLANDMSRPGSTLQVVDFFPRMSEHGLFLTYDIGDFLFIPFLNSISPGERIVDTFTYVVTDGFTESTATIEVILTNDPAVLTMFELGQTFASGARQEDIDLGDLDNDGDLDVFLSHTEFVHEIWLNDGSGEFQDSGMSIDSGGRVAAVELADLDNDGDVDSVIASGSQVQIWLNDGFAHFQLAESHNVQPSTDVAVDDLDGDGDLDLFVAISNQGDVVFVNDGLGSFVATEEEVGEFGSTGVQLADVDGDGDSDAIVSMSDISQGANRIWLNRGDATFLPTSAFFGDLEAVHVAVGDLDGDGDVDAITAHDVGSPDMRSNRVWLNDGMGYLVENGQKLGSSFTTHIELADLDGDGDLDAFETASLNGVVWINAGSGRFSRGQQVGDSEMNSRVALGDIDGDTSVDAVVVPSMSGEPVRVWRNTYVDRLDYDDSGVIDSDDIDYLCVAIRDGSTEAIYDVNRNGTVDLQDLVAHLDAVGVGQGDITADGVTDVSDFAVWNAHKFTANDPLLAGAGWSTGDLNCDGVTDTSDFNIWNANRFTLSERPADFVADSDIWNQSQHESIGFDVARLSQEAQPVKDDAKVGVRNILDVVFAAG